jgi:hypothetical protein
MKTGTGSTTTCALVSPKTLPVVVPVPVFIASSSGQGRGEGNRESGQGTLTLSRKERGRHDEPCANGIGHPRRRRDETHFRRDSTPVKGDTKDRRVNKWGTVPVFARRKRDCPLAKCKSSTRTAGNRSRGCPDFRGEARKNGTVPFRPEQELSLPVLTRAP